MKLDSNRDYIEDVFDILGFSIIWLFISEILLYAFQNTGIFHIIKIIVIAVFAIIVILIAYLLICALLIKIKESTNMAKKIWIVIGILVLGLIGYGLYNYAYNTGYDVGETIGYENGYDKGYEEGYDDALNIIKDAYYDSYNSYGYSDEAGITSSSVYVTMTGSKYHDSYCQYVIGKSNLSYYDDAYAAQRAGYTPCSVCQY